MKTRSTSKAAFFQLRISVGFALCSAGLLLALAGLSESLTGMDEPNTDTYGRHHHYKLIDTGTLGGATSSLGFEGERDINNRGTVVSLAETTIPDPFAPNCFFSDCFVGHAVRWQEGVLTDLGALPTVNNSGPIWLTDSGLIGGFSQNGLIDPLTGSPEFEAVLFENGGVTPLGTFGGNESTVFGVNDHRQAVGCATNAVADPFGLCLGVPQQSRAFLWQNGVMRDLGTLGGPDALAELVNDRGQVTGWSLTDSRINHTTGIPTQHPFLWENGRMTDLGTIGGTAVVEINNLNNHGQVVGGMNVVGDQFFHPFLWDGHSLRDLGILGGDYGIANWLNEAGEVTGWATIAGDQAVHAFLWRRGTMTDLGVISGDQCSVAYVINSKEQVVGGADDCFGNNPLAFIWERNSIADLNRLVCMGSGVNLTVALGLNEAGEIAAQGVTPNGDLHAFLLIPCDENHPGLEGCDYSLVETPAAVPQTRPAIRNGANRPLPQSLLRRMSQYRLPGRAFGPKN